MERSVVVFPQPEGPSRVNISPSPDLQADVVDREDARRAVPVDAALLPLRFLARRVASPRSS